MNKMRWNWSWVGIVLTAASSIVVAQDAAQLQKLYDDTLQQLQQSQDRKNQLANENAKLVERITELETELRSIRAAAEREEFMRTRYQAFRDFVARYPAVLAHFVQYAGRGVIEDAQVTLQPIELYDRNWPFSAATEDGL